MKTKNGHNNWCKKGIKKYLKEYYKNNKEKIDKASKKWNKEHKQQIKKYKKQYRESHKNQIRKYLKQYKQDHKKEIKEKDKNWYLNNKERLKIYKKKYNQNHKEEMRKWRNSHKKERNKWHRERRKKDLNFKISNNLRGRTNSALKQNSKSQSTISLIGCDFEYLAYYLQKQFKKGMNWDNYGRRGWHIDHIIPCSSFDLSKKSEQQKCFHYSNLQPLWAWENMKKSNKILSGGKYVLYSKCKKEGY